MQYSHQTNQKFDIGQYNESIIYANKCIEILTNSADSEETQSLSLKWKNLLRIVRCGIYNGILGDIHDDETYQTTILEPLEILSNCGDAVYEMRAKRMISQVKAQRERQMNKKRGAAEDGSPDTPTSSSLPSIHRASLYGSWTREYYNYGHDRVTSALGEGYYNDDGDWTPACPSIDLSTLQEEHLSNLNILFGGVGDARHVYTTLCDANKQYKELSSEKKKLFKLNLLLNDINSTALTRDVLMIAALDRLGNLTSNSTHEEVYDYPETEAFRLAVAIQYMFFGYAQPISVHNTIMTLIGELICEDFVSVKKLIRTSDDNWSKIKDVMNYWRNAEEGVDDFPTVTTALRDIFKVRLNMSDKPNTEDKDGRVQEQIDSIRSGNRKRKEERIAAIDNATLEEFPSSLLDMLREDMPVELRNDDGKLLDFAKIFIRNAMEKEDPDEVEDYNSGKLSPGRALDKEFLIATRAILPPFGCQANDVYARIYEEDECPPEYLLDEARKDIKSSWKVNRTMFCPIWMKFRDGMPGINEYNPVADIGESFLCYNDTMTYLEGSPSSSSELNFFQCTSLFFLNVAKAMNNLMTNGALRIDLSVDSITTLCRSIQDGKLEQRKFHRIYLSNIADYIGTLSIFTEVAPLLHCPTKLVPSFIQTNVLYNCQVWSSYSQFVYSATAISSLDACGSLLGLTFMNSDNIWVHCHQWKGGLTPCATKDEVTRWLHRLLLIILLPPKRESYNPNENCPMNIAQFLRTCVYCIEHLKYPIHWIGSVLDDIITACSTGVLKTKAEIPSSSPLTFRACKTMNKVNIKPFRLELLTQISIWKNKYEDHLLPLNLVSHSTCRQYRIVLWPHSSPPCIDMPRVGCGGKCNSLCLGFVLSKNENLCSNHDEDDLGGMMSDFSDFISHMNGEGKVRQLALDGDDTIHFFSCMRFDRDLATGQYFIEFLLTKDDFNQYSSYYVHPFRTDSWVKLGIFTGGENSIRLRDAKLVDY